MKGLCLLAFGAISAYALEAEAPGTTSPPHLSERAIEPTQPDQIGVNNVDIDPEPYRLEDLGPNHPILTIDGKTYRYIENHVLYVTVETKTVNDQTTTSTIQALVQTATADEHDQKAGDISITFPQAFADKLRVKADQAIAGCGLAKRDTDRPLQKRGGGGECLFRAARTEVAEDEGYWSGSDTESVAEESFWEDETFFEGIDVTFAVDAPDAMALELAELASEMEKKKAMILFASFMAAIQTTGAIAVVNLPKMGIGAPSAVAGGAAGQKKCDVTAEVDEKSPICEKDDCKGVDGKCTIGDNTGCGCSTTSEISEPMPFDEHIMDEQDRLIQWVMGYEAPLTAEQYPDPQCNRARLGQIQNNQFHDMIYKGFCDSINSGSKTDKKEMTVNARGEEQKPASKAKRALANIFGRTPPPNPNGYQGYTIDLSWSGGNGNCPSDCHTAFERIAMSSCGHQGGQQNVMAVEGRLDTGCGVYYYKINVPGAPKEIAGQVGDIRCSDHAGGREFTRANAEDAINRFCGDDRPNYVLTPDKKPGLGGMGDRFWYHSDGSFGMSNAGWEGSKGGACGYWEDCGGPLSWSSSIRLHGEWAVNQTDCAPKDGLVPPKGDSCKFLFYSLMDSCDVGSNTAKYGGKVRQSTEFGCVNWEIVGHPTGPPTWREELKDW